MMELAIDRLTEQMSEQFDFDDEQLYQTQELFKERVIPWLNDNRGDLMQISNEYMEMLWEKKAPSPEQVARWSIKLIPLVDEFGGIIEGHLRGDAVLHDRGPAGAARCGDGRVGRRYAVHRPPTRRLG